MTDIALIIAVLVLVLFGCAACFVVMVLRDIARMRRKMDEGNKED